MTWNPYDAIASRVATRLQPKFDALDSIRKDVNKIMIDTTKMDTEDTQILQALSALTPLVQQAVTEIGQIKTSDAAAQAIIDKHVTTLQPVADGLAALQASLSAAENPPATPAA